MKNQFFIIFCAIFFAGNLFGQNCGTLSAFSYTTSASSTSGNTIYNFTISALSTIGGDKSMELTVDVGSTTVVAAKCYISAPNTGAPYVYTEGPFDVPTGTVNTNWSGYTNSICGGSSCLIGTTALPVELINFNVKAMESYNLLLWATASELNNKGFEIERSINGIDWQNVGWVDGHGTSNTVRNYEFTDFTQATTSYYRLKQIDYDGEFEYSDITIVEKRIQNKLVIYPNPTTGIVNLNREVEGYKIYDAFGLVVMESNNHVKSIDLTDLVKGLYLVETRLENNIIKTQRIILEN